MGQLGGGYSSKDTSFNNTSTTSGTSATNRNLLPQQALSAPDIYSTLHSYMMNPQQAVQPARMAARDQVGKTYSGLADRVRQQFLTTGGGRSGKAGQAELEGEIGRAGALTDVDNTAAVQASQLPLTAAGLAEQFLGINLGQTTGGNQTTTGSGTGSQSGWNVGGSAGFSPGGGGGGGAPFGTYTGPD